MDSRSSPNKKECLICKKEIILAKNSSAAGTDAGSSNKFLLRLGQIDKVICSTACFGQINQSSFDGRLASVAVPLSRLFQRLPDHFLVSGASAHSSASSSSSSSTSANDSLPALVFQDGRRAQFPQDLEALRKICHQAPVGKGTQTVVDLTVRRVLETTLCQVEWPSLDRVLSVVAQQFSLPQNSLHATLHKVLLYQENDLFLPHYDSKKSPDHLLTLSVTIAAKCVGGDLIFYTKEDHLVSSAERPKSGWSRPFLRCSERFQTWYDSQPATEWNGNCAGHWACWFATQQHAVKRIDAGYRVVATYNVMLPSSAIRELHPRFQFVESPSAPSKERSLLSLPPDILRSVLFMLVEANLSSIGRLAQTCRTFSSLLRPPGWLLGEHLKKYIEDIQSLVTTSARTFGFVLQHRYSFDGKQQLSSIWKLRGRDRTLAVALSHALHRTGMRNAKICVRKCEVNREELAALEYKHRRDRAPDNVIRYRVLQAVVPITPDQKRKLNRSSLWGDEDDDDDVEIVSRRETKRYAPKSEKQLPERQLDSLNGDFRYDFDYRPDFRFWPYWNVIWLNDFEDLRMRFPPHESEDEDETYQKMEKELDCRGDERLWGNEAAFTIYWYHRAVLLIELDTEGCQESSSPWSHFDIAPPYLTQL